MKRIGGLLEPIADFYNLRLAFAKACQGKRDHSVVRQFGLQLDCQLQKMRHCILTEQQSVGGFHQFVVHDPKKRIITAPCFEERVLHHAIMNVCEPIFERRLIDDTYACRRGRGRIAALHRVQKFARGSAASLKLDVRKYFDSIPHDRLKFQLHRVIKDPAVMRLFGSIIDAYRGEMKVGLPIGSLTSQHLANLYLNPLDRFIKEHLRIRGYVRYMDDMLIWGESTRSLVSIEHACRAFASDHLGLTLKYPPEINHARIGVNFLGCRIFREHMRLNRRSKIRLNRKLRRLELKFMDGEFCEKTLQQRATATLAFATAGGVKSWQVRRRLLEKLSVSGQ